MLASMSKVAQIIELSYELEFWALRGLWTRLGPSEDWTSPVGHPVGCYI
jgi:hypothetical protein